MSAYPNEEYLELKAFLYGLNAAQEHGGYNVYYLAYTIHHIQIYILLLTCTNANIIYLYNTAVYHIYLLLALYTTANTIYIHIFLYSYTLYRYHYTYHKGMCRLGLDLLLDGGSDAEERAQG